MVGVNIIESVFGVTKNKNEIKKYTLSTSDGFEVSLISYGAAIQSIRQPDKDNQITEITLGYDTLQEYVDGQSFFGATVGRVASRIKNGRFELDGKVYELDKSDSTKKHYLHGTFHKRVWDSTTENGDTVVFKYQSPDGESGFPGQVDCVVKYTLTNDHRLTLDFHATTTKPTPINITNHVYFNLAGDGSGTILDHLFEVSAEKYTPLDDELIPTGEIASVENTPFDFRKRTPIGERINESFDGYDMMFVIEGEGKRSFSKLVHQPSGRAISIESTQKGLQLYTGNFLNGNHGRNGHVYKKYGALCLETQNYTDCLNYQPMFPSSILHPGEKYHEQTTFHFYVEQ
ncbi:unnamed protein product [Adineta ricciae]|uniref:Aldose 1-epimerase n=1 Tax=Adineta ricciae TaxID=249248 RepID=A0A814N7M6_ADIRI|nr:unnamed protein product [Adineta ricciae]CAF1089435.1 unnamed protein product [Adineta ricciae]